MRLDHEMEPLPDDSPLPEPRSKIQDGAYFNTPMQLTPGQRVHTVEGPGRQSGTNRCIGTQQERMVNTGEQAPGFKRRSGGSTAMPVAPTGPTTFAPLAEGPSPPKAADSCLPQEPPPQTSAESSIGADPPSRPAAAAMAAFGGKPGALGSTGTEACNWGKAKVGLNLTEAVENVQKERANLNKRGSFLGVVESAKNIAEERKQAKIQKQEQAQYFNPSVVGSVNRHRRIHSSRRTRMLILLDEPRTSRLAATVFITMLGFIFVSVCLVVIESMGPSDDMREPLWWVEEP